MQYANSSTSNSMSSSSILSSTTRNSTIYYSRPAHEDNGNSSTSKRNVAEDNNNDSKTSNHDIFLGAFVFASLVLLFIGLYKCRVRFIRRNDMATTTTTTSSSTNTRGNRSSMSSGRALSTTSLIRNIGRGGGRGHGGDGADVLQTLLFGQQERRGQEQEGGRGGRMDSLTLSLQERRSSIQNQIQTKRLILAKSSFDEEDKSSRNKSTVICDQYVAKANDPNEGAQQHPNKGIPPVCYSTGSTCDGTSSTNTHCTYTTSSPLNSRSFNIDDFIGSECVICCMPYKEGDVVSISRNEQCSHVFHLECMLTWLCGDHDATCPSCRQDYLKDTGGLRTAASGSTSTSSTTSTTNIGFDSATPTSSSSTNTDDDDDERNTLYYDSSVDAEEQEETLFMHQVEQCNNNRSSTSMTKNILLANDYDDDDDDDDAEEFKRGAPFLLSSDDDDDLSSFLQQEETDEEAPPQIPAASMATANTTTFIPVGNFVEDLQYDDDDEGGQIAL